MTKGFFGMLPGMDNIEKQIESVFSGLHSKLDKAEIERQQILENQKLILKSLENRSSKNDK